MSAPVVRISVLSTPPSLKIKLLPKPVVQVKALVQIPAQIAVDSTATGAPGTDASVVNVGTPGNALLQFTIPEGMPGGTGAPGPANNLSIGTVEGGETADATITGASPNQTLNLVLPKGEKGDPGENGEDGAPGANGAPGAPGVVQSLVAGSNITVDATDPANPIINSTASGSGDVVGPAAAVDGTPAVFDGTTGKLLKNITYAAFKTLLSLVKGDVGLGNVDNTSDTTKNSAVATLTNKTLTSPVINGATGSAASSFTGTTQSARDNSTKLATTAYVDTSTREKLSANRTYYVRTDGSDSNNGLGNTSGGAFLTIQRAVDVVYGTLDLYGFDVTIQLGNSGTFTGQVLVSSPQVGAGNIILSGDITPANTGNYIVTSSGTTITVQNAKFLVQGIQLQSSGSQGMTTGTGGLIYVSGYMRFGTCPGWQIRANNQGAIYMSSPANVPTSYAIVGGAPGHAWASTGGLFNATGSGVTVTTNVTVSTAFVQADRGANLVAGGMSFTLNGTVTGSRYLAQNGGTIFTNGGGTSFFPGSTAGSGTNYGASPYGMYI